MARLNEPQSKTFRELNSSIDFDYHLAPYDIAQSRAHVKMLASCGIITDEDRDAILDGLGQVAGEIESGSFKPAAADEDIHMAIERRLTEVSGPVGGKLHTARSRNDQVATDMALYLLSHSQQAIDLITVLQASICDLAKRHINWALPGYTHMQRAQPIYLSHHLLAYFWMLERDSGRFRNCLTSTSKLPLGSGALAGVNWKIDREMVASELGFDAVTENSLDAVSSRDSVIDYLSAAATCATHLSRLGAEIVIWSSEEFGFCEVADSYASTSSIMPQKKNPDAAELLRAKAARVVASLSAIHSVMHGLPLAYSKDLQEDKEGLFDAVETVELCLRAAQEMVRGLTFNRERMERAAADEFLLATDVADYLVGRGVPFRQAHSYVADLVRSALNSGKVLSEMGLAELHQISDSFDEGYFEIFKEGGGLESKLSQGGTALEQVKGQLEMAEGILSS